MAYYYGFASVYDAFTENVDYGLRSRYVMSLLAEHGVPDGILLDLACGTGSMTARFLEAGYEVIAVDNSPDMLSLASEKLGPDSGAVLLCQDMRELDLYGTVDCAVCSLDGVNHLLTPGDVREAFGRVSLFLRPGGIFIFDVNTVYKHRSVLSGNSFVYENEDAFLVWQNSECDEDDTVDYYIDVFISEEDGSYTRVSEDFSERAYSEEVLRELLEDAGLEVLSVFGDLSDAPASEKEERIYFIVKKR